MAYLESGAGDESGDGGCVFCRLHELDDASGLILGRGEHAFLVLNLYPYANGHTMVIPRRHVAGWELLRAEELADLGHLTQVTVRVLQERFGCDGFNLGVNQGRVAGAGIPDHVHKHVVPRWFGDTNFMPVVAQTRVIPEILADTWTKLRPHFDAALAAKPRAPGGPG